MKIETGKIYRLRDGRLAMPMEPRTYRWTSSNEEDYGAPRELHYFGGLILDNAEKCSWGPEGRYSPIGCDHHLDIIAIDDASSTAQT